MTPKIGGVGPLTVSLLFEHVLKSTGNLGTKKKA
jgi:5,10-methylene-tetrahydrofolate dehydrogenase/methenyl tetrahydrofolate cyclohydrolase